LEFRMRLSAELYDQIAASLRSDSVRDKDKRREPRVGMAGEADLITVGSDGKRVAGLVRIRDVSVNGIGFCSTQPLDLGQRFVVQLQAGNGERLWLVCLAAYCRKINHGNYIVGARIKQHMGAEQIRKVEAQTAATALVSKPETPVDLADMARISKAILE
jgi:hypothetical protein